MGIGELFEFEKTDNISYEERKTKPIRRSQNFSIQTLVCKTCKKPVEKGFQVGASTTFYSCYHCDSWVTNVEWKDELAV